MRTHLGGYSSSPVGTTKEGLEPESEAVIYLPKTPDQDFTLGFRI